jgi:hypothetical protein
MTKYDKPLLALGLFGGWGLTFEVFQNFFDKTALIICSSIVWLILSGACFYFIMIPQNGLSFWRKNKLGLSRSNLLYRMFLVLSIVEAVSSIAFGIFNWQTVVIDGFVLFTLIDFVSVLLISVGIVMLFFVLLVWSVIKPQKGFYSPIHSMIVRINNEIPRERANQLTVGAWVSTHLLRIDHQGVSEVFNKHAEKFKDEDLKMWIGIEKEINGVNGKGFFLGQDRQKWFDDLEARYNR